MSNRPTWNTQDYASISPVFAAHAAASERGEFIRKTYLHMAGAILGFILLETVYLTVFRDLVVGATQWLVEVRWGWLLVLGGFLGISWMAESWARSSASREVQYAGLGLYILGESIVFAPLLYIADEFFPGTILSAAIVTLIVTVGLTAVVFLTRTDLSFMRMALYLGGLAAMAAIVASLILGFNMGTWFPTLMVVLAGGYILYHTSNVLHHYRTDQYVAAALSLFASVALLFWYILQLFMRRD